MEAKRSRRQDDADIVRREYATEAGLAARIGLWAHDSGPQPLEIAFEEVLATEPRVVLEVGCDRGEFAERLRARGLEVVALDQSARMVELTAARGVDARVGDVQALPFPDGAFNAAVANFMLYHVPDLDVALSELARVLRPGGTLVAATNGLRQLAELWELVGRDLSDRRELFMLETGDAFLARHFRGVRRIDLNGTIELDAVDMRNYIANSVAHKDLAERVPDFQGRRKVTTSRAVFVAKR